MDRELAPLVALTAFRSSADMTQLLPILKEHCSTLEYEEWKLPLATAAAEIGQQVLQRAFALYPELENFAVE